MSRWTPADEDILRRECLARPVGELAATLGRSPDAVKVMAHRLGVTSGHPSGRAKGCACAVCERYRTRAVRERRAT